MGNVIQCTSPINIVKNLQTEKICKLKCSYQFNYTPTTLSIWNAQMMMVMEVDEVATPPVVYNDENYMVEAVLLVSPSIHTFNGKKADAELMIFHASTNFAKKLMVCVPIKASSTSVSDSSTYFDLMMSVIKQTAATPGQHTIFNNATFSLNKFVPMTPYFSYTGANLLWNMLFKDKCYGITKNTDQFGNGGEIEPIASDMDYIVFHIDDAIAISPQALQMLKQVIPYPVNIPTIDQSLNPGGLYFNPNGPISNSAAEIYIDCRPTGDDGEILVTARQDSASILNNEIIKKLMNATFLKIIVGALVMLFLWKSATRMINGIAANSARMSGGGKVGGRGNV
jgi:hypothetical protein